MRLRRGGQPKARDRSKDLRFKYIFITGLKIHLWVGRMKRRMYMIIG